MQQHCDKEINVETYLFNYLNLCILRHREDLSYRLIHHYPIGVLTTCYSYRIGFTDGFVLVPVAVSKHIAASNNRFMVMSQR